MTTRTVHLAGGLDIAIDERGTAGDTGVLLLHGGAGPLSMAGLAGAMSEHAYVITPDPSRFRRPGKAGLVRQRRRPRLGVP